MPSSDSEAYPERRLKKTKKRKKGVITEPVEKNGKKMFVYRFRPSAWLPTVSERRYRGSHAWQKPISMVIYIVHIDI